MHTIEGGGGWWRTIRAGLRIFTACYSGFHLILLQFKLKNLAKLHLHPTSSIIITEPESDTAEAFNICRIFLHTLGDKDKIGHWLRVCSILRASPADRRASLKSQHALFRP